MEEYLRRVQSRLGADISEGLIHAVLGGPEPDVDTVAATLCLALHLSQKEPSGGVCVPLLCSRRSDTVLPEETVRYLQRVKIRESSLLWRDDVDLVRLYQTGKLSLTLLRDGLLDSSEYHTLESSILQVVHRDGQQDGGDGALSAVTTVAREILQEAAEHIRASLGEVLREALQLQREALWIKHGCHSEELEDLMRSLEQWVDASVDQHKEAKQQDLMELLMMGLKEFSDGEMTIALTSLTTDKEDLQSYMDELKSFSLCHGYDSLVILLSISDTVHHPRQQMAVYSNNTDMLNQICRELEESSSWSLSGGLEDRESLQVYHIPINTFSSSGTPPLLEDEIGGLLKDFFDRRSSVLACHPSSRTSSTDGIAGSVEFSQGSSGINDMDGSDIERAEGGNGDVVARVMADGEEDTGAVGISAGGELLSPDSGMTTIRSSRSSKESSVFLSDDSPVGEAIVAGGPATGSGGLLLRNPSPLGLSSLSPPVPPERRKYRSKRNRSDNFDLFSFDSPHSSDHPMPTGGEQVNSGGGGDEGSRRAGSSSFSELDELSLLDFSAPNSLGGLESRNSSVDHHGQIHGNEMIDTVVPPTPVNSLVGSRPPSSCGVRFFPEDVVERISGLQHKDSVSSSLSETWDELSFDTQGALSSSDNSAWNRLKDSESPQNIMDEVQDKFSVSDMTESESREEILKAENAHHRTKSLEPQLSLITEQTESGEKWNRDTVLKDQWNPVTLADLQLTPPEDEATGKWKAGLTAGKDRTSTLSTRKTILNTLTPDTSKEEDDGIQGKKRDQQMELLDFWTYSAQKGFLKSDSGTTTSYPESLDMWNMTIWDDSLSPLTTPDNLSENSGSFYGLNTNFRKDTSMENPIGYSDGGMEMWNTTIQEDSSSTITTPEGPENGKDLSHMESLDAKDSLETHANKQTEEEKCIEEKSLGKSQMSEEVEWRSNEQNVKIVIEAADDGTQGEETGNEDMPRIQIQRTDSDLINLASKQSESVTSPHQSTDLWDLPVHGMITSTSEYDNVGAATWSPSSSPDNYVSPVVDLVQLEGQSSPFIAVTKPIQTDERQSQYQTPDPLTKTEYTAVLSDKDQTSNQVFLFDEEPGHMTKNWGSPVESRYENTSADGSEETDWMEFSSNNSPFVLVDSTTVTQQITKSPEETAESEKQTAQPLPPSCVDWDSVSKTHDGTESASSSHLSIQRVQSEDETAFESQKGANRGSNGNVQGEIPEAVSLLFSPGEGRNALYSPDSVHTSNHDKLGSSSDGDSFSGLEMEYIVVPGTVKEANKEFPDRPKQSDRQSKGTRNPMETFCMLSCAATVLETQVQPVHRDYQENTLQSRLQQIRERDSTSAADTELNDAVLATHYQTNFDDANMLPEMISLSQSKTNSEAFLQSDSRETEEGNYEDELSTVVRSVSPSLRQPSDHFLKTREECYVHSQISMEDSDEGEQPPSAPPPSATSLGDFQVWGGQFVRQDTSQTTSEPQSPVRTNSSVSHTSSLIGTPVDEMCFSTDKGLGLPFSGDLMEEEHDEDEHEEEAVIEGTSLSKWTPEVKRDREEGQAFGSSDLLSFTEDLIGDSSFQQTDIQTLEPNRDVFLLNREVYYDQQPMKTNDCEKWSFEQQTRDHEASHDIYSPALRHQDGTSQLSSQLTNENAAYQWTGSQNTTQGQTKYGYNYHHIDQRTENQCSYPACADTKSNNCQQNTTDVYAEFTTDASAIQHSSRQTENYFEAGANAQYSVDDAPFQHQYMAETEYLGDSTRTSELQCSEHQADGQSHYEPEHAHYQYDEQQFYQSDVQAATEDRAQYVPDGYVHFLLSRHSQQGVGASGMMVKTASSEETAEELENREDPPSSADTSGGSNQRRKLAAPPMNVSLDHSEGSLLSEDALDTEDEALDTGDDLDVNIDDMDTPDEADSLDFNTHDSEGSDLGAAAASSDATAGHRVAEESRDGGLWRSVVIGEQEHRIDMKCIEPYKRVISHGGYYAEQNAIIVFAACFLPDSDCDNYNYVMENLFLYVISTLELMVAEDYMVVYLNGATPRRRMPGFTWMKRCYQMIDRRLKKNLKMFIIVHPSWFIRTLLGITRPFISSKFSSKIKYVHSLKELGEIIPMEYVHIPSTIVNRLDTELQDTSAKIDKGNSAV
ncbi:uncharacterized protein PAE49_006557 isoform 3-T3 [Odontesthes bonariensis]|uniref:uncharacterized protein LOC142382238 isoform X3 n=1 Tax=Odontesthes bonariensis TaxID=219752 RepID=UPI003F585690